MKLCLRMYIVVSQISEGKDCTRSVVLLKEIIETSFNFLIQTYI